MTLKVPQHAVTLMAKMVRDVLPQVYKELNGWKEKASAIPDSELRKQAMASIESKVFHCEGGAVFALLALDKRNEGIRFIVAYQTISDYLDNLCDRSTSFDPADFRALHASMFDALTPGAEPANYYRFRKEQDDGGYLRDLVKTCQDVLSHLSRYETFARHLLELAGYYCDLQVHKHVKTDERVARLVSWHETYREKWPDMSWYEFSACTGSTLGIFCLVSYALRDQCSDRLFLDVTASYFPWVQGLHILLDYFIDQQEDFEEGDLNFCFYYEDDDQLFHRFRHFMRQADEKVSTLPDAKFHRMIIRGLFGLYLADRKVKAQRNVHMLAKKMIRLGGRQTLFFYTLSKYKWFTVKIIRRNEPFQA